MDPSKQFGGVGGFNAEAPSFQPGQQQRGGQQEEWDASQQQQQQQYYQQGYYQQGYYGGPQAGYGQPGYPSYNSHQGDTQQQAGGYHHQQQYDYNSNDQQQNYGNRQQQGYYQQQRGGYYGGDRTGSQQQSMNRGGFRQGNNNSTPQNDWRGREQTNNVQTMRASPQQQQQPKGQAPVVKQSTTIKASSTKQPTTKTPTPQATPRKDNVQGGALKNEAVKAQGTKQEATAGSLKKAEMDEDWEAELENANDSSGGKDKPKPTEKELAKTSVEESSSSSDMAEETCVTPMTTGMVEGSTAEGSGTTTEDVVGVEELKGKYAKLCEPDPRPHLNVVFIGHVDAGKSTTCGNILFLTGQVDHRTIEKYEKEAKEKNRDTWFFAFITDVNEEERQKGKTVEVGRAAFELENTRFTILDAPGHKSFVPNMISGAAQADVAVLIISARKGEFETGFERGGQTREHAMLAKTLGVSQLVVAVNKMDDPTCNWDEGRYRDIEKKLTPFLRGCGYNPAKDITFVPLSGLCGQNLKLHATDPSFKQSKEASWYDKSKPTLFDILNNLKPPERNEKDPLRIPLLEGFRDQGVMAVGKVEAGTVVAGQNAILMPKRLKIQIVGVQINDEDVSRAKPGENVALRVTGVEEDQITKGMVLCPVTHPCPVVTKFKAQVMIVELLEHRPLITAGYSCVIHAHTACEEVQLTKLLEVVDKATKKKKIGPQFVKGNSMVICEMLMAAPICMEAFDERPQLGRFTLRDEGKTIAIGKVLEIFN